MDIATKIAETEAAIAKTNSWKCQRDLKKYLKRLKRETEGQMLSKEKRAKFAAAAAGILKECREKTGMSQKELARLIGGVDKSIISQYENGKIIPRIDTWLILLHAMGYRLRIERAKK